MLYIDISNCKLEDLIERDCSGVHILSKHLATDDDYAFEYLSQSFDAAVKNNSVTQDDDGIHFETPLVPILLVKNSNFSANKEWYPKIILPKMESFEEMIVDESLIEETSTDESLTEERSIITEAIIQMPKPTFKENRYASALYNFAYTFGKTHLKEILKLAGNEKWSFAEKEDSLEILENYINYTFYKAQNDGNLYINGEKAFAAFNTGLVDSSNDYIYICFRKSDENVTEWRYWDVCTSSSGYCQRYLVSYCNPLPKPVNYFKELKDVFFDPEKPYFINFEHIIYERLHRLPLSLIKSALEFDSKALNLLTCIEKAGDNSEDSYTPLKELIKSSRKHYGAIKAKLDSAICKAIKNVYGNYRLAIPGYFPCSNSTSLLIPLELNENSSATSVIAVQATDSGNYLVRTVLNPHQAYLDARLIGKIESCWLAI